MVFLIQRMQNKDCVSEADAMKDYNDSIRLATEAGDGGTAELLRSILLDEEKHLDWLETQSEQISQIELQNYLVEQIS